MLKFALSPCCHIANALPLTSNAILGVSASLASFVSINDTLAQPARP
jgi:hypothetical protein